MFIEILVGGLLFVIGLLTYWLAPRIGPNPIFGVRIGYAFASREIWDRTNRAGGALIAFTGMGVVLFAFVLRLLLLSDNLMLSIITSSMIIALIIETIWLGFYARSQAQAAITPPDFDRFVFRWSYLAPVLVTFALLGMVLLYLYPILPIDRIATHFDFNDQPSGWMSRESMVLFFIGMGFFLVLLDAFVVFLATREPLIAFARWGARWRLPPDRGLMFTGIALAMANLLLVYAIFDIARFTLQDLPVMPLALFVGISLLLAPLIVALFFVLAKRQSDPVNP